MKWIKLFEEFQLGDLNFMSPEEIQELFMQECDKKIPDLNLIRVILDNGLVDVNAEDKNGWSPLYWTVEGNNIALAKLLISAGADVNSKNIWGNSPLHFADSIALAEYLISAGADVNAKNINGYTPLALAVLKCNVALVELLIKEGADANAKDRWDESPLDYAVYRGDEEMQALLKKHGAVE